MSPKHASRMIARVSFGLALLFIGIAHYRDISGYVTMVSSNLGPIEMLGTIWGYILPALMIIGGALFTIGMFPAVAVWTAGIAIGSIPAGMMLKTALSTNASLGDSMAGAVTAFTWLIVFLLVSKSFSCGCASSCGQGGACGCGGDCKCGDSCACGKEGSKKPGVMKM